MRIKNHLHAIPPLLLLVFTTFLGFTPILLLGLIKLIPNVRLKLWSSKKIDKIAVWWCDINNFYLTKSKLTQWQISGLEDFNTQKWYLVIANHQSWLDIVVLQKVLNRKIPVLKFFIKDSLKWIPLLGFSWWAMGCAFMKRYSKEYLEKNPHKKGKDTKATYNALKSFKLSPSTLMSFIEGTRFTNEKKQKQNSPYQHLLKPRAGGIGVVINNMGEHIKHLLDVTIIYPEGNNSLWQFLCRRINSVKIHIREVPIPAKFLKATLIEDERTLNEFREWLNHQWLEKDVLISTLKGNS